MAGMLALAATETPAKPGACLCCPPWDQAAYTVYPSLRSRLCNHGQAVLCVYSVLTVAVSYIWHYAARCGCREGMTNGLLPCRHRRCNTPKSSISGQDCRARGDTEQNRHDRRSYLPPYCHQASMLCDINTKVSSLEVFQVFLSKDLCAFPLQAWLTCTPPTAWAQVREAGLPLN